ncbi:helix-turn-helix domain-containing protein [Streptomyces sp. NPDC049879]|uniref:helix-turn-helix domain-containing protein n=1 Tax=Streptomyces sp. NPDC049879 TaxID=3365598 RepID=UPI0037A63430
MVASSSVLEARRAFGRRLREIREDAGITARRLAEMAGWHESKCSRIENGKQAVSQSDIRVWAACCAASDQVEDLLAVSRGLDGMYVEWRRLCRSGLRQVQERSLPLYERTRRFRIYEPGVVPGLVQTAEYAAALMRSIAAFLAIPDDVDKAVTARLARQAVLHTGDHRVAIVLEESALRARIGGTDVMAAQLGQLLAAATLPRVSLGVIPMAADRDMWPVEGFWLFDDSLAFVELVTAKVTVTQPHELRTYQRTFARLAEMAVYGKAARRCITEAIDALG